MNLYEAEHLARTLMKEHGLSGWSFAFDHARRRFGCCNLARRRISLSRPLVLLNGVEEVRDTILHEIAHALTPGDGHGPRWRAACVRIGARPQRCYSEQSVAAPPRRPPAYQLGCPRCQWWVPRHRRTRRRLICTKCRSPVVMRACEAPPQRRGARGESAAGTADERR